MTALLFVALAALQQPRAGSLRATAVGTADTSPFRRLALPTPTLRREGRACPGPRYWQQRADYVIRALA